jgi:glycosyltransferase involved in cell wall biosynthesis
VVKDREKLRAIYSRATLFASFSYFETFCYAGLEAASSGASIICFDSSSLAEVVRNYKIGKVISASRCGESIVAETVEYAQRLFASPGARKAMPAELVDLVSPARIAARHEALYESLLREIAGR